MLTGAVGSLELVESELEEGGEEVRSAVEWAQVRAMVADGFSQREIAARLGIKVKRLIEAGEPPSHERPPADSMLDSLEPVLRPLVSDWPQIKAPRVSEILRDDYGDSGSIDLVRKRLRHCAPVRCARRSARATGQGR